MFGSNSIVAFDKENQKRLYIKDIDEATSEFIGTSNHENSKGVIRIKDSDTLDIYSLSFHIEDEVLDYLKTKNIKGYFFVSSTVLREDSRSNPMFVIFATFSPFNPVITASRSWSNAWSS